MSVTSKNYVELACRTEAPVDDEVIRRAISVLRLDHASKGMDTEVGEFTDALKRFVFYGRPLDRTNCVEELGDLMWYVALACDALGVTLETVMASNIAKLQARYPQKFTENAALVRDLDKEREALEK